jgi:3',5'-cyclic AMP phosphodiesterase CpdA
LSVLLQISDPHFGTEQAPVCDALAHLARSLDPDLVVLSGDVTQRARRGQFAAARAFIDRLAPKAFVAIPGNHDIPLFNVPMRILAPYRGYIRAFGETLEPEFESEDLLVCCIKTTRRWRHSDGEISAAQIERAARRFRAARAGQLRVAVVHQPMAVIDPTDVENLLNGASAAARAWAEAGCDLVLGGHIHLPYVVPLAARHAPMAREVWAVQAGTAVSTRVRDGKPNSVNVVRHEVGSPCRVERWDHDAKRAAFVRIETTDLRLTRPGAPPIPAH